MSARPTGDEGMATAELAVALPALVAVLLLACGLLAAMSVGLRCEDAARLAARSAARGDSEAVATGYAHSDAPAGASVAVDPASGGLVRVVVRAPVRMPGPLGGLLPTWTVSGTAVALDEADSSGASDSPGGSGG